MVFSPDSKFDQRSTPPVKQPAVTAPVVVWGVILAITLIHGMRNLLLVNYDFKLILAFAFIPARLTVYLDPEKMQEIWEATFATSVQQVALAQYVLARGGALWTIFTHTLLHGSWMHLVFNALWLLAFGAPVARRLGAWRFLVLFGLCGAAGALSFWFIHPNNLAPVIGASGAVSGIMAASIRFIFVKSGMNFDRLGQIKSGNSSMNTLLETFTNRQSIVFIIIWFVLNFISGVAPGFTGVEGAVAWEAHIGGFIAGLVLVAPLNRKEKSELKQVRM